MFFLPISDPATFTLLAITFLLEAQSVFLINELMNKLRPESRFNLQEIGYFKVKILIKYFKRLIFLCSLIVILLIIRNIMDGLSLPKEIIGYIDFIALLGFVSIWFLMFVIALISYSECIEKLLKTCKWDNAMIDGFKTYKEIKKSV